jgi:ATP-dependent helicase/nuclease subunit A
VLIMTSMKLPPKPSDVTWTDDQWKAIVANGQDILVAAAAGSGKTAVLVERMIKKIISEDQPIDVDEMLVVTFTNASAAEMKHRMGEALEKAIDEDPTSRHLRKQLSLLSKASISTLHSFCLDVIRKFYYKIEVDPGFRIADETEAQLLRDEVLDTLFEEEYGKEGNTDFFDLVDMFSNDRSDTALQVIIRELYDFARSNPSPKRYLQSIVEMYDVNEETSIESLPFYQSLIFDIQLQLQGARGLFEAALELTKLPEGPSPRAENFTDDIRIIDRLLDASQHSWEELYHVLLSESFSKLKTCKKTEFDEVLIEKSQKLRDKGKKMVQAMQGELFSRKPQSFIHDMQLMKPYIQTLVRLVGEFAVRFDVLKREKGLVDFADLEHYCLQILSDSEESSDLKYKPSEEAMSYRRQFKEVLVDEYQDTNMVQEAILNLVTKDEEKTGNLFMVGDVKQSIYRFRLAEPNLFLGKYNRFTPFGEESGLRIDLARNFRSRKEVLHGTNYLFKQIMGVLVGEINYDEAAELINGASYPEEDVPIELYMINSEGKDEPSNEEGENEIQGDSFDEEELAQSQLEAKLIATKIHDLIQGRKPVYNPKTKSTKPASYKDIVILLRSMTWAPQIMEELKDQGIPVYANLSTGYFEATEVVIMMSLLNVIDNPYQDIPLASVLRSPIVGLTEEDLARIRMEDRRGSFYEALTAFYRKVPTEVNEEAHEKIVPFMEKLSKWRTSARQGALSELLWQLFRETGFFDFVGGLPGGKQRQANLRALYDRARQYEETSFRGLFRFLRFIERMRERGDDLGAAGALGESEDVVRIMTIHSSKGLEFPVVFVAGLGRQFNMMDIRKSYMLDKELGFASKYVDPKKRISYPSLPQLAFKRKKRLEMLAEEMRVLYVALTRAKEYLYLIGTVKNADKKIEEWEQFSTHSEWLLKEYDRQSAKGYLDWIGPALIRHQNCQDLRGEKGIGHQVPEEIYKHPSCWKVEVVDGSQLANMKETVLEEKDSLLELVTEGKEIPRKSERYEQVLSQLQFRYPYVAPSTHRSKQSVSEVKRQRELQDEESGTEVLKTFRKPLTNRPRFMQEKALTPAERGTAMHAVMQQIDLNKPITFESVKSQLDSMVHRELLTLEQMEVIDIQQILQFFESELGARLLNANTVLREIPFSLSLPAREVYADWKGEDEAVLLQGIIDCVFEDEGGLVLLDFKTDGIHDRYKGGFEEARLILEDRYKVQIELYRKALEEIWKKKVAESYLFFFDGAHMMKMV